MRRPVSSLPAAAVGVQSAPRLLRYAVLQRAHDWLHRAAIAWRASRGAATAIASGPYWRANSLTSAVTLYGVPLLRPTPRRVPPLFGRAPAQPFLLICGSILLIFASIIATRSSLLTSLPRPLDLPAEIQTSSGPTSVDPLIAHDQTDPGACDLWIG